jgi:hypothetical protein
MVPVVKDEKVVDSSNVTVRANGLQRWTSLPRLVKSGFDYLQITKFWDAPMQGVIDSNNK